jgi:ABC-2 type transport system ATP-binding protein
MDAALTARRMEKRFGAVRALAGMSFEVRAGELYGLVGPDGAGKTTAIRALAGLIDLDEGEARVLGLDPRGGGEVREALGLLPQQYSLYRDLTVWENLRFFARLYVLPREVFRRRAERLLGITRLERRRDRGGGDLAHGRLPRSSVTCTGMPSRSLPSRFTTSTSIG